jgi:hypothetical protein
MAEKIKLNFEIDGLKEANKQLAQLEDTAKDLKKEMSGLDETSDDFKKINKQLEQTNKQMGLLKDATGQVDLDAKFEDVHAAGEPLSTQLGTLTDRMYALAAAGQENSAGFKKLQEEAVKIRQTIIKTDQSIDDMANNKGLSTFGAQIGGIGESLMTLDFDRASKQAAGLAGNVGKIKFGGAIKGVKALGSTFMSLGKALLLNPIFLIAAAIAAIVAIVILLMKKLGILKPVLDAIGKVFGWIGDAIDAVIQGFKNLTDWLGFTNNAAEDWAETQAKSAEKAAVAQEKQSTARIQGLDTEIALMKISGESTTKLEQQKLNEIKKTALARKKADKAAYDAAKLKGELSNEELRALRETATASRLAFKQAGDDIKIFNATVKAERAKNKEDAKKERQEAAQERKDQAAADRKEAVASYKQFQANRLAAERKIQDLSLESIKDTHERELEANKIKYERLREDTLAATNLTRSEKASLETYYDGLELTKNQELIDKKAAQDKAAQDKLDDEKKAEDEKNAANELAQQELLNELTKSEKELELIELQADYDAKMLLAQGNKELEVALALQKAEDIKEINDRYREEERVAELEAIIAKTEIAQGYASSVNTMAQGIFEISNSLGKQDEKSKEKRAERQFKVQKALNLGMAVIDGFKAITTSLAQSPIAFGPIPNPAGIASLAFAAVTTAANIAKIASSKYQSSGGGGGGGGGAAPSPPSVSNPTTSAPTPPSITNLFDSEGGGAGGAGEQALGVRQTPVIKAVVVESDITNTQNRLNTYQQRSEIG